ncbi:substrate-binding domain-containing protein [Roseibacterium sp. SDUM158017]|uniref:substrate-binding domain-containing protein n=1 Tax=Roseicyclus salinarum TaxID=3036773 RepID=UPI002414FF20|nr:substrate-binding domain-containing protein [Roseibacterium sp. SDUM158017]MDG4647622.1 substrate-binding domain-containing protein [Roseibacterium sp. SDUM158017]
MNLRQLADSLGLSQTTVSRALNGYPEVREETRARVLAAASAANYAPNSRARRLATGRAMTIGHVLPLSGREELVNPIFADFLAGAGEVYAREGYDLLLSIVPNGEVERAYRQMAANGSVDGVMLQSPRVEDARIALMAELGMPFLVHGRTGRFDDYSWLDIANVRAFRRATEFLLDLGHRRIALINGQEEYDFAARRRRGFGDAMAARGLTPDPRHLCEGVMTEHFGFSAAAAMLDGQDPPTAFLVSSIISAIGVRRAASERGLWLGRDISVICHDDVLSYIGNDATTTPEGPPFTSTRSSIRDAGRRCAEILIGLIREPGQPPVQELWETELNLGRSTGPAPAD